MKKKYILQYLIALVSVFVFSSCDKDDGDDNNSNNSGNKIEFRITSQTAGKTVDIDYDVEGMSSVDINDQTLPWSVTVYKNLETGDDINMQVASASDGVMTAEILIDGQVVESESDDNLIILLHVVGLK